MGITQKTTPNNFKSNKEWTWQGSPNSVRIIEKETWHLLYTIEPVTQENLVLASYWVEDHNRMASMLEALEWVNNECLLCGGFKPKHDDWCSFRRPIDEER